MYPRVCAREGMRVKAEVPAPVSEHSQRARDRTLLVPSELTLSERIDSRLVSITSTASSPHACSTRHYSWHLLLRESVGNRRLLLRAAEDPRRHEPVHDQEEHQRQPRAAHNLLPVRRGMSLLPFAVVIRNSFDAPGASWRALRWFGCRGTLTRRWCGPVRFALHAGKLSRTSGTSETMRPG